jgi:hypothetical protein
MVDTAKGAPLFDVEQAIKELSRHLPVAHPDEVVLWEKIMAQEDATQSRS